MLRLLLEARREISGVAPRRGEEKSGSPRARHKEKARRREGPTPRERAVRLGAVHARNDGDDSEPWIEQQVC